MSCYYPLFGLPAGLEASLTFSSHTLNQSAKPGQSAPPDHNNRSHGLLARSRRPFLYTPQYHIRAEETVTLFFLNPCPKDAAISISLCGSRKEASPSEPLQTLQVPSLGVRNFEVTGLDGYVTCQSKLPMCRPIIFVRDAYNHHHFDVFHT
jgi:hypothetical protein